MREHSRYRYLAEECLAGADKLLNDILVSKNWRPEYISRGDIFSFKQCQRPRRSFCPTVMNPTLSTRGWSSDNNPRIFSIQRRQVSPVLYLCALLYGLCVLYTCLKSLCLGHSSWYQWFKASPGLHYLIINRKISVPEDVVVHHSSWNKMLTRQNRGTLSKIPNDHTQFSASRGVRCHDEQGILSRAW